MIQDNHTLREAVQMPLSSGGKAMSVRRAVVIHYTEGVTARSSVDWWKQPQNTKIDLGAHLIIDRDGTVIQCRPFDRTISHAGVSRWRDPKSGVLYTYCNAFTIGIELANAGNAPRVIAAASKVAGYAGTIRAKHRNGGKECEWEKYPDAQFNACVDIVKQLVARYKLDDITGHDCIAPERKTDPGPAFPMECFRELCGFKGLPAVHNA